MPCREGLPQFTPGTVRGPENKRRYKMNQDNRVLCRSNARELTENEVQAVSGALTIHTFTPCIVNTQGELLAGDTSIGEC